MMFRLIQFVVLWTTVALAISCAPDQAREELPEAQELQAAPASLLEGLPEAQELQAAPATITIDGVEIALEGLPEARELQAAPATLTVDGMEIAFTATVSRIGGYPDMGPRGPAELKGASVHGTLRRVYTRATSPGRVPFPDGVAIQRLFVVSRDRVWVTKVKLRERLPVGVLMATGVGEGPKWEPGTLVDVIAEVVMPGGNLVYVAARGECVDWGPFPVCPSR